MEVPLDLNLDQFKLMLSQPKAHISPPRPDLSQPKAHISPPRPQDLT